MDRLLSVPTTNAPPPLEQRFPLYDWQRPVVDDHAFVLLLTGGAGGGKSRLAGELIHDYMLRYPGSMGLMLRKAREFTKKSPVPMMRRVVIKDAAEMIKSDMQFNYANGSTLAWGGMKDDMQREALRSIGHDGALDIVWLEEANAFSALDFEELTARMRGKAGGYRQIILTTNPDAPLHWIHQRLIVGGEASVYYSYAGDNPANPPDYIDKLRGLTGIQRLRLLEGKWVQAEGAIYPEFSMEHNVSTDAEYNPDWQVCIGVDDGYVRGDGPGSASYHPRVILFAHVTPQGGLHVFDEQYHTQTLAENSVNEALARPYRTPEVAYVDSSAAELKARIHERGIMTIGATHTVSEGVKNVRRLIADGDGIRLLKIHPRCKQLLQEMVSYRYDPNSTLVQIGEPKPLKLDDHGPDSLRYLCWRLRFGI